MTIVGIFFYEVTLPSIKYVIALIVANIIFYLLKALEMGTF